MLLKYHKQNLPLIIIIILITTTITTTTTASKSSLENQLNRSNATHNSVLSFINNNNNNNKNNNNNYTLDSAFPDEIESNPYNDATDEEHSHEIVAKPLKKKPYRIEQKNIDLEDRLPYKDFDSHSEVFNFNLTDLDDSHQSYKRGDLNSEEIHLLRDATNQLKYDSISSDDKKNATTVIFVEKLQTHPVTTNDEGPIIGTVNRSPSIDGGFNSSRYVYKVNKNAKVKMKGYEILKKDEVPSKFTTQFNSVNGFLIDQNNTNENGFSQENYFQLLVNLYDHFYWQSTEIRINVSPACGVEVLSYLSALNNNFEWAQRAYDTSGHYRGQYRFGNDLWLGQKSFCEDINSWNNQNNRRRFELGFFAVRVAIRMPPMINSTKILQIGECLPKSCTRNDIKNIMELDPHARIFSAQNTTKIPVVEVLNVRKVPSNYCIWKELKFQILVGICTTLIMVILIATIYERHQSLGSDMKKSPSTSIVTNGKTNDENLNNGKGFELYQINVPENNNIEAEGNFKYKKAEDHHHHGKEEKLPTAAHKENFIPKKEKAIHIKILLCFAMCSNANRILSLEKSNKDMITCIHGIRVISLLWTIMVHTYLQLFTIAENRFRRKLSERSFIYQIVGNATFSVDSFFFISGLLVTLVFLRSEKEKLYNSTKEFAIKGATKSFLMIIYRYLRLTPAYLFVIVFNQLSLTYVFDRSVFNPAIADHLTCSAFWWRNILYINNWYPFKELCMIWSWYLANDMQFYIMTIILLIISTRHFKFSFLTILLFLITSWGISGLSSLHHHYTHKVADPFESFNFLYDKPWQRVGTYIIGIVTGYIIHRIKTPPKVPLALNLLLWAISLGLLFILTFGVWTGELSILATAFYVSIGHTAWGVALVWITLSCCWKLSPTMDAILSYKGFLPLSRLTYCTYLIHPVLMLIISFQMEGPIQLNHSYILTMFLGNAALSFIVAFLISISFEAPVIRLLRIAFQKT